MMQRIFIALIAGAASALMFASISSGASIAIALFYLAPLPLMVGAVGWGSVAGLIAALIAAAGLGTAFGLPYFLGFLLTAGIPAWWLGHLTMLAQSVPGEREKLNWYPIDRIVLWITAIAVVVTSASLFMLGDDAAEIREGLRRGIMRMLGATEQLPPNVDIAQVVDVLVSVGPPTAAIVAVLALTLNLWMAGRTVKLSQRLHRPWPDLRTLALPQLTLLALGAAVVMAFFGGIVAMMAHIVIAALLCAYVFVGLAVVHSVTAALRSRLMWLSLLYGATMLFGWPALALAVLGIAEQLFGFRAQFARRIPPPTLSP